MVNILVPMSSHNYYPYINLVKSHNPHKILKSWKVTKNFSKVTSKQSKVANDSKNILGDIAIVVLVIDFI